MAMVTGVVPARRKWLETVWPPRFSLQSLLLATLLVALGLAACRLANLRFPYVYTGRKLDVTIDGAGYIQVAREFEEQPIQYIRGGRFWVDSDYQIRIGDSESELQLYPVITIPSDGRAIVSANGDVHAATPQHWEPICVGSFQLAVFPNPDGLREAVPGVFVQTEESGVPTTTTPGKQGAGTCAFGWIENSDWNRQDAAFYLPPTVAFAFAIGAGVGFLTCAVFVRRSRARLPQ